MKLQELLINESRWIKGVNAVDPFGHACDATGPHSTRFCLLGGIRKCYGYGPQATAVMEKIIKAASLEIAGLDDCDAPVSTIISLNDSHSTQFPDILKLIQEANV